jgi:hypothetical protein
VVSTPLLGLVLSLSCTASVDTTHFAGSWTSDTGTYGLLQLAPSTSGASLFVGTYSAPGVADYSVEVVNDTLNNVIITDPDGALFCGKCSATEVLLTCPGILSRGVCSFVRKPVTCSSGEVVCDGACTNLESSPDNCGRCGHACGSARCLEGSCVDRADAGRFAEAGPVDSGPASVDGGGLACGTPAPPDASSVYSISPVGGEGQMCPVSCADGTIQSIAVTYGSNCHPRDCAAAAAGCAGASSCTVTVDNTVCGDDPCPNVAKGATISITCSL